MNADKSASRVRWDRDRVIVLCCFVAYFIVCFLAYRRTSTVERAPLPALPLPHTRLHVTRPLPRVLVLDTVEDRNHCESVLVVWLGVDCTVVRKKRAIEHWPSNELVDVDRALLQINKGLEGNIWTAVLIIDDKAQENEPVIVGQYRHIWCKCRAVDKNVVRKVKGVFDAGLSWSRPAPGSDADALRVHSQSLIHVSMSLVIEDPSRAVKDWNFDGIQKAYLDPFVDSIASAQPVEIDSQVIYYAPIADQVHDIGKGEGSYVTPDALSRSVGVIGQWNPETVLSPSLPALNMFVYIPSCRHTPLRIAESVDQAREGRKGDFLDSFLLPRWGGLVIANSLVSAERCNASTSVSVRVGVNEMLPIVSSLIAQIRILLGIPAPPSNSSATVYLPASMSGITAWEMEACRLERIIEVYERGVEQLNLLHELLESNPAIPVSMDVASVVQESVGGLHKCQQLCAQGDLGAASDVCRLAGSLAHAAFFDPSMIGLLYFPEDHVYAVYLPFFVPTLVPVALQVLELFKYVRSSRSIDTHAKQD